MRSRTLTAAVGLLVSLAISVVVYLQFDTLLLFLFLPFVPFLFRSGNDEEPPVRECPRCGYQTRAADHEFCPRDGARLE